MADESERQLGKVLSLPAAPDAIELRHLRSFVAVADELNFGRAASRLYLSQPALSRQIRALERLVGCDLLRRSTHRVELTLAGEALLDRARRILGDLDDAVSATRSIGGELASRAEQLWEPVRDQSTDGVDVQALRTAYEALHAQFQPIPEVGVRPVNTGGVPSLLLTPQPQRPATLLFLHGGGGVMGSAFGYRPLAGALAVAAEANVILPEYRLAPEHPFPAALEDAMSSYLWMLDHGTEPGQVTLAGDSAGAALVLSVLLTLKQQELPMPGGAVLLCPGIDPTFASLHKQAQSEPQPLLPLEQLHVLTDMVLGGHPIEDPVVSPLLADLTGLPPMLIHAGTGDAFVDDAHRLVDRAKSHGVDARLELYPVSTHVFHIFWSFLPEAADALHRAGDFAREVRGDPAAKANTAR